MRLCHGCIVCVCIELKMFVRFSYPYTYKGLEGREDFECVKWIVHTYVRTRVCTYLD